MAITLTTGTGQTANCPTPTPLYPAAGSWSYSKDDPGEAIYTNINATLDQPNSIRFAASPIANMFANSPLSASAGQRVDGLSLLAQVNEVWKFDDAADSLAPYYFPVSAHLVLKLPSDALVTSTVAAALLLRLVGSWNRNGTDALAAAINPWLHGICKF